VKRAFADRPPAIAQKRFAARRAEFAGLAHYEEMFLHDDVFWTSLLPVLDLPPVDIPGLGSEDMIWGDGFEIETLINVRVAAAGARITEVGSVEQARLFGESNLNAVRDGLRVLRTIVAERRRQASQHNQQADGVVIELRSASVADDETPIAARIQGARGA